MVPFPMTLSDPLTYVSRSRYFERQIKGVYGDTTQLNSTDPVEQRTAKSVVFFVYDVMTYKLNQLGHYVH